MITLGNVKTALHSYSINTNLGKICVHARSSNQASSIARKAGFYVRDVNMVG